MAVKRGELGIMGTELNSELAKAMKVDAQRGPSSAVMPVRRPQSGH